MLYNMPVYSISTTGWGSMQIRDIVHFINSNDAYFIAGLSVLTLVLIIGNMVLSSRIARLRRRRSASFDAAGMDDIINMISEQSDLISKMQNNVDEVNSKFAEQAKAIAGCVQNVGIVRFNAFDDIGGEQSFALALLDANKNGVVVSSLYGRQDTRLYTKTIVNGECERPLSDEERCAISNALSGEKQLSSVNATSQR